MTMLFNLETLTDEEIADLPPAELHAAASELLAEYARITTVASVSFSDAVLSHPGALTAIDNLMAALSAAYADREPQVTSRFGGAEFRVRSDDDALRDGLRYAARRAREARGG